MQCFLVMAPEDMGEEVLGIFSTEDKARDWMKANGYEHCINMVYSARIDDPGFGEWLEDPDPDGFEIDD